MRNLVPARLVTPTSFEVVSYATSFISGTNPTMQSCRVWLGVTGIPQLIASFTCAGGCPPSLYLTSSH